MRNPSRLKLWAPTFKSACWFSNLCDNLLPEDNSCLHSNLLALFYLHMKEIIISKYDNYFRGLHTPAAKFVVCNLIAMETSL